jgi:hypothetical protein
MFRLIRWFITLIVLVVIFVVGDHALAHAAQNRLASSIKDDAHLSSRPTVQIHGFPFVTQVAHGKYTHITVVVDNLFDSTSSSTDPNGSTLVLELRGVHIPLGKAISGKVSSVPVDNATGTVTAGFADLAAAANVPGLSLSAGPQADEVTATETLTVAGVRAQAKITAALTTSGHTITARATQVSVASLKVPASVLTALESKAGFTIAVPGLPPALKLGAVSVGVTGVALPLAQDDLVLSK